MARLFTFLVSLPGILILGVAVTACAPLEDLRAIAPQAGDFSTSLSAEYLAYAESEAEQSKQDSAEHYARKGLAAYNGREVLPDAPEDASVAPEMVPTLSAARQHLLHTLSGPARRAFPKESARAQLLYDCWLNQLASQDEGGDAVAVPCAQELTDTLSGLGKVLSHEGPKYRYELVVPADSEKLPDDAQKTIADISLVVHLLETYSITVKSGDARASLLAERALAEAGVMRDKISVLGGEHVISPAPIQSVFTKRRHWPPKVAHSSPLVVVIEVN